MNERDVDLLLKQMTRNPRCEVNTQSLVEALNVLACRLTQLECDKYFIRSADLLDYKDRLTVAYEDLVLSLSD